MYPSLSTPIRHNSFAGGGTYNKLYIHDSVIDWIFYRIYTLWFLNRIARIGLKRPRCGSSHFMSSLTSLTVRRKFGAYEEHRESAEF